MHPPLAASNVFCVHDCTSPSNDYAAVACSNNNQAQLHTHVSVKELISRRLTRPRVASRFSVRPEESATARLRRTRFRNPLDFTWISDFRVDFGFQSGFLDFRVDFWISQWISGFHSGFLDFSLDFWISVWISADRFLLVCSRIF